MKRYFLSVFILIWCSSGPLKSAGENTISPSQIIRVNETITSTAENFALGFFRPGNSTNLYVGVWYNKVPLQTVIWVANREKPITDSSAVLSVTSHGDLVILVNNNTVLWSSSSSGATATTFQAGIRAVLLDNGNVVLRHNNGTQTWQSFDYPTDTLLPGMKVRLDQKTPKTGLYTSWKDDNNPAAGEFSIGVDSNWPASQLVIWRNSFPFWRSGIYKLDYLRGFNLSVPVTGIANQEEVSITLNSNPNIVTRYILDKLGRILQLTWDSNLRKWNPIILVPLPGCDSYGRCGPSGSCYDVSFAQMQPRSDCKCLEGYEPRNQQQGCQRQNPFECMKSDKFMKIERMKLPNFPIVLDRPSRADCEIHCLSNCSCTAYFFQM